MITTQHSLLTRPDTFFGVCQGLGENLRIHPNLFRIAFGMAIFFAPLATIATYFLLGLVVAATHYALPIPPVALPLADVAETIASAPASETDHDAVRLAA